MSSLYANATVIPIAEGYYGKNTALTTTTQMLITVTVPPLQLQAIRVHWTDLVLTNTTTAAVNVALVLYAAGFGFPSPFSGPIGPPGTQYTTTVAASGFLYQPITFFVTQGGAGGIDLTKGGVMGLEAYASAAGVNIFFSVEVVEGYFGGTL